jgi:hypothetical protein
MLELTDGFLLGHIRSFRDRYPDFSLSIAMSISVNRRLFPAIRDLLNLYIVELLQIVFIRLASAGTQFGFFVLSQQLF